MAEFVEWTATIKLVDELSIEVKNKLSHSSGKPASPFESFKIEEYWAYADYKYMIELLDSLDENVSYFFVDQN